jgi:hypothetical protein
MAKLIIRSITTTPTIKLSIEFNNNLYALEYPNKQAALDALSQIPNTEEQMELALMLALREWKKTDTNLTNLAGLVNQTCTINLPVVKIV